MDVYKREHQERLRSVHIELLQHPRLSENSKPPGQTRALARDYVVSYNSLMIFRGFTYYIPFEKDIEEPRSSMENN
jgi:hypothetical protein